MEIETRYDSVSILGPTASGKTKRAVSISKVIEGEIISADSRQVYKNMDIGTGKDLSEYENIKYHLIDIVDAGEKYNLFQYLRDFSKSFSEIRKKGKIPVVCGGSGMYIENALAGLKLPEVPQNKILRERLEKKDLNELTLILSQKKKLHNVTDIDTKKRAVRALEIEDYYEKNPEEAFSSTRANAVPLNSLIIGVYIPREQRRMRITQRLNSRLREGLIDEVNFLLEKGINADDLIYYGLEYKYVTQYILGSYSYDEFFEKLEIAIHQFAKRQMTWFRGMEKRGFKINWLPFDLSVEEFNNRILNLLIN